MAKKKLSIRTAERLIRAAYDYEELAARLRYDGHEHWAETVKSISSQLGKAGRAMADEIEGR